METTKAATQATKSNGHDTRPFEGPFLILGMLPAWPSELERRKGFMGAHSNLASLFPIQALSPSKDLPFVQEPAPVLIDKALLEYARPVPVQPATPGVVSETKILALMQVLDRPRTAKQIARKLHVSKPTAYAWLKALQGLIGAGLKVVVRRAGSRGPMAKTFCL